MIKNDIELEFLLKEEDLENKNLYEMTKEKIFRISYLDNYYLLIISNIIGYNQEIFQKMLQEIL